MVLLDLRPQVRLFLNPWSQSVWERDLLRILADAAEGAYETLGSWVDQGDIDVANGKGPFACVLLDPTNVDTSQSINRRIMAMVLYGGEKAEQFIPNAAAKADAHAKHGRPNGLLVESANFCLRDDDFAWGNSAEYKGAIAGGSGLSVDQDELMARWVVESTMKAVHAHRASKIDRLREENGSHAWYGESGLPGREYSALLKSMTHYRTP